MVEEDMRERESVFVCVFSSLHRRTLVVLLIDPPPMFFSFSFFPSFFLYFSLCCVFAERDHTSDPNACTRAGSAEAIIVEEGKGGGMQQAPLTLQP